MFPSPAESIPSYADTRSRYARPVAQDGFTSEQFGTAIFEGFGRAAEGLVGMLASNPWLGALLAVLIVLGLVNQFMPRRRRRSR